MHCKLHDKHNDVCVWSRSVERLILDQNAMVFGQKLKIHIPSDGEVSFEVKVGSKSPVIREYFGSAYRQRWFTIYDVAQNNGSNLVICTLSHWYIKGSSW